jgi:conserved repeat domain
MYRVDRKRIILLVLAGCLIFPGLLGTVTGAEEVGGLGVTSVPSGASVYVDGIYKGVTPIDDLTIPSGQHTLRVSLAGYTDDVRTFTITAGWGTDVHVVLTPSTGGLTLNTQPQGAIVILDGVVKGTTPVTVTELVPGAHTVRFSLAGYQEDTETITVTAGQTVDYTFTLLQVTQAATTGGWNLNTIPSGATVVVDGVVKGTTPITLSGLAPGSYTVRFSLAGYQEDTETLTVTAGLIMDYTATLSPVQQAPTTGGLNLNSVPSGAIVVLDGVNKGVTPLAITGLNPGSHDIRITLSGYEMSSQKVNVISGQNIPFTVTLKQLPSAPQPQKQETCEAPVLKVSISPSNPGPNDVVTVHTQYSLPVDNPAIEIYMNDSKKKECQALSCEATFNYQKDIQVFVQFKDGVSHRSQKMRIPWSELAKGPAEICPCSNRNPILFPQQQDCRLVPIGNTGKMTKICITPEPGDGCPPECDNCRTKYNPGQEDSDGDGKGDVCDQCPLFNDSWIWEEVQKLHWKGKYLAISENLVGLPCEDDDKDNIPAFLDNCPQQNNNDPSLDEDKDGVPNLCDQCPGYDDKKDTDGDNVPDDCDYCLGQGGGKVDTDGDKIGDDCDNCRYVYNPGQEHDDNDVWGNACDNCWYVHNYEQLDYKSGEDCKFMQSNPLVANVDATGTFQGWKKDPQCGDGCDICKGIINSGQDRDGDGVDDACDTCWDAPNPHQEPAADPNDPCAQRKTDPKYVDLTHPENGWISDPQCGAHCYDGDQDKTFDAFDNCNGGYNPAQLDGNQNGIGDICECRYNPYIPDGGPQNIECRASPQPWLWTILYNGPPGEKVDVVFFRECDFYPNGYEFLIDLENIVKAWDNTNLTSKDGFIAESFRDFYILNIYASYRCIDENGDFEKDVFGSYFTVFR